MRELSLFIDESGDFGEYSKHSPYYIITIVFHDQERTIDRELSWLDENLKNMGLQNHCIHTGPLIRREEDYQHMNIDERRRIMNKMMAFVRKVDIKYKSFSLDKRHIRDRMETAEKLAALIRAFIQYNYETFLQYDSIKIYYDNGQVEVNKILASAFTELLDNVEFKKVLPSEYRLFQVADLCCTFELLRNKQSSWTLTNSEKRFFGSKKELKKNYLKVLDKKEFTIGI